MLKLLAREKIQRDEIMHAAAAADIVPASRVTALGSADKFSKAVTVTTCREYTIDCAHLQDHMPTNTDFKSDAKPTCSTIGSDSFAAKAVANNETFDAKSADLRHDNVASNELPGLDSNQRMRWLSGVSCTSSSTSGGEESPRPGTSTKNTNIPDTPLSAWLTSGRRPQLKGQTSTPVNGWLDSASTPSQHLFKSETEVGSLGSHGSINSVHLLPVNKSPNNLNTNTGSSSVPMTERLHSGICQNQDSRPWLSSNTNLDSRWSSRVSVPEPFWSSSAVPFHPQNEGMLRAIHSPGLAVPHGSSVANVSQTSLSLNGSFSDTTSSMQLAQNVSPPGPATPATATTPSKKRVCDSLLLNEMSSA